MFAIRCYPRCQTFASRSMFATTGRGLGALVTRRAMATSSTPVEDTMRAKITEALKPTTLDIFNDSHMHSHHKAMQGSTSKETHFRVVMTSEAFRGKFQPARHRMVYALLKEELERDGGIHALQLRTRTPEEEERHQQKLRVEAGTSEGIKGSIGS